MVQPEKPARRRELSRTRILEMAVSLADASGLEAISMRKLAAALDVEAMSLYNHVANKEDLLDGMIERVIGEITLPIVGHDWKDQMRRRCHSARQVFLAHPWAPLLVVGRISVGPAMLRYIDRTVGCFISAGFGIADADRAWNAVDSQVYGFVLQELNFPIAESEYASAAASYLPMINQSELPHMHAMSVLVATRQYSGLHDFDFGLNLILDGLERKLADNGK